MRIGGVYKLDWYILVLFLLDINKNLIGKVIVCGLDVGFL